MRLKLLFVTLLLVLPTVNAGVGIVYSSEIIQVPENRVSCVEYKVYNPWEGDTYVKVSARGDLSNIVQDSKTIPLNSNTFYRDAVPIDICFSIPKVYEDDCLFWKIGCKRACSNEEFEYSGDVIALEMSSSETQGTGSQIRGSVTAPLTIRIKCEEQARNYVSLIGLIGAIIFGIISIILWNNSRLPLEERKKRKANKLREKLKKL
jgi:hypothetical protein